MIPGATGCNETVGVYHLPPSVPPLQRLICSNANPKFVSRKRNTQFLDSIIILRDVFRNAALTLLQFKAVVKYVINRNIRA